MKKIIVLVVLSLLSYKLFAQQDTIIIRDGWTNDSIKKKSSVTDSLDLSNEMIIWNNTVKSTDNQSSGYVNSNPRTPQTPRTPRAPRTPRYRSYLNAHLNGIYFGFLNFANTDYKAFGDDEFMELDWGGSFSLKGNILQNSVSFNRSGTIGLVGAIGLEYQRMLFENNIRITKSGNEIGYIELFDERRFTFKRSSFKALYFTVPVMIEFQFPRNRYNTFYIMAGATGAFKLHSRNTVVYKNEDNKKRKDNYKGNFHMLPFKCDLNAQVGFENFAIWGSYTATRMFQKDKGPELHPYAIGFAFTFD